MKHIFTLILCFVSVLAFSQERLLLNNGMGIQMGSALDAEPIYIVVANSNSNAIGSTAGAPGGILSEDENHIVKWNIGTGGVGPYGVPFVSQTGGGLDPVFIALAAVTGGDAGGGFNFSTYHTVPANTPYPSDVTHMSHYLTGANNAAHVIDRFYLMDPSSYTTVPTANIRLYYDEDELDNSVSPMLETDLLVQRFNNGNSHWFDLNLAASTVDQTNNFIAPTAPIASADFFKSWTISKASAPLPIELLYFKSECAENSRVLLSWATASEQDNKEFTLERSEDGIIWEAFDVVSGAGNSSTEIKYEAYDNNPFSDVTYYRLSQTDFDGTTETFDPTTSNCDGEGFEFISAFQTTESNYIDLVVSSGSDEVFDIRVMDMSGKTLVYESTWPVSSGISTKRLDKGDLGHGIYLVSLQSDLRLVTKRILLN